MKLAGAWQGFFAATYDDEVRRLPFRFSSVAITYAAQILLAQKIYCESVPTNCRKAQLKLPENFKSA